MTGVIITAIICVTVVMIAWINKDKDNWIDNSEEEMLDPELVDFYERVISLIENAPTVADLPKGHGRLIDAEALKTSVEADKESDNE